VNQQSLEFVELQSQHTKIVPHVFSTILMDFWPFVESQSQHTKIVPHVFSTILLDFWPSPW
jgi:uncharacterized membrane protein SirB2